MDSEAPTHAPCCSDRPLVAGHQEGTSRSSTKASCQRRRILHLRQRTAKAGNQGLLIAESPQLRPHETSDVLAEKTDPAKHSLIERERTCAQEAQQPLRHG